MEGIARDRDLQLRANRLQTAMQSLQRSGQLKDDDIRGFTQGFMRCKDEAAETAYVEAFKAKRAAAATV